MDLMTSQKEQKSEVENDRDPETKLKQTPEVGEHHMPFTRYFAAIAAQLVAIIWLFSFLAPKAFAVETSNAWSVVGWSIGLGIPLSLFEYLYHRYLLHSAVLPFLGSMHRAHRTHHGLTYVKAPVNPKEPAQLVEVRSAYPIEEEAQEESMMFPLYSLPIFIAVFSIMLGLPLKLIFPGSPIFLSLFIAVTAHLSLYEGWHAVLHLPFERFWLPLMQAKWSQRTIKRMYGFHLMHHWRPNSNLAVVGFWGFAIWDHIFRTHTRPERLPLRGAEVTYEDSVLEKPLWPISQFDKWETAMYKGSRSVEKFLAKIFLGRTSSK